MALYAEIHIDINTDASDAECTEKESAIEDALDDLRGKIETLVNDHLKSFPIKATCEVDA